MPVDHYGPQILMPADADFYLLSNEDIGFESALVTGTNDNYVFALPMPSSLDLDEESLMIHSIEYGLIYDLTHEYKDEPANALDVYMSFLNKSALLPATWRGALTDSEDEWLKSQFAGPIRMGRLSRGVTAAAAVEGSWRRMDNTYTAIYHPEWADGIDCFDPLYITLVNQGVAVTLATNATADDNFSANEFFYIRVWYTKRKLTNAEKLLRQQFSNRFMIIES